MTSNEHCRTMDTANSNHIIISVDSFYIPSVTISTTLGTTIILGETDTFKAAVAHGGPWISYQWVRNSSVLSGETSDIYYSNSLSNNDSITCVVTSNGPCGFASFNSVVVHVVPTGVASLGSLNGGQVLLYPNPTNGTINVKADVAGTFYLYSIDGKSLGEYKINEGITNVVLPTDLATGIYMGRYVGDDGNTVLFKIGKE